MSLTTRVVVFGGDESSSGVQIFSDPEKNINEDGSEKTTFYQGDSQHLLIIVPSDYRLLYVLCTDGVVAGHGSGTRQQVDRLLFSESGAEGVLSLSQLPAGDVSPVWYGNTATLTVDGQEVTANFTPCIADLSYSYRVEQYELTAPSNLNIGPEDGDDWPIGVVVYVEKING